MRERRGSVIWMQAMSDFTGSPAEVPCVPQTLSLQIAADASEFSLTLSNAYGRQPLELTHIWVSVGGMRAEVTFGGEKGCVLPVGGIEESDHIFLSICSGERLMVEIEPAPGQRSVTLGSSIDRTMVDNLAYGGTGEPQYYYALQAVTAYGIGSRRSVCFFGDSLTNQGRYSGPASRLLLAEHGDVAVFNCGISGNRLLHAGAGDSLWVPSFGPAGIERFERDVTCDGRIQPEVIFAMLGVNDLYQAGGTAPASELPSTEELIAGLETLEVAACRLGAKLLLGTLTPFKGSISHESQAWDEGKERTRCAVNEWILARSFAVDVDALVRDGDDSQRLSACFDCGDHLHFSAAGGEEIGRFVYQAIDRALVQPVAVL